MSKIGTHRCILIFVEGFINEWNLTYFRGFLLIFHDTLYFVLKLERTYSSFRKYFLTLKFSVNFYTYEQINTYVSIYTLSFSLSITPSLLNSYILWYDEKTDIPSYLFYRTWSPFMNNRKVWHLQN